MATKGLDGKFLHYGIRQEDLDLIETLCRQHELDTEWIKEDILRSFHAKKVENIELVEESVVEIIRNAISKIKS